MAIFDHTEFDAHEGVHFFQDSAAGFSGIIAVHSTYLGPSAGGTRLWTYANDADAIKDALRLSKAMSYKNAMADLPHGGGKGVILRPSGDFDRKALFAAYGRAVNTLGGRYYAAEDVGVSPDDMHVMKSETNFVAGLNSGEAASGDPSPVTADGVFRCLKIAAQEKLGAADLKGIRVAVQGLGHVGYDLAKRLFNEGAKLIVADINQDVVKKAEIELDATVCDPAKILAVDVDILAPCALGGVINTKSLPNIQAKIVAGAANNQLATADMGEALMDADILFCPDYVINAGGIINIAAELSGDFNPSWVEQKLVGITKTFKDVLAQSKTENLPTNIVADRIAQTRIGRIDNT